MSSCSDDASLEGDMVKLQSVSFRMLTDEDVLKKSVVEITAVRQSSENDGAPNGLYDSRMGTTSMHHVCPHCKQAECTGHNGHIAFPEPMFVLMALPILHKLLRVVCGTCSMPRFKLLPHLQNTNLHHVEELTLLDIDPTETAVIEALDSTSSNVSDSRRLNLIAEIMAKTNRLKKPCCWHVPCEDYDEDWDDPRAWAPENLVPCEAPQPVYELRQCLFIKRIWNSEQIAAMSEEDLYHFTEPFLPRHVKTILSNIPRCVLKLLGFKPDEIHPKDTIIKYQLVTPPLLRPKHRGRNVDDITRVMQEMLRLRNIVTKARAKCREAQEKFLEINDEYHSMQYALDNIIVNSDEDAQKTAQAKFAAKHQERVHVLNAVDEERQKFWDEALNYQICVSSLVRDEVQKHYTKPTLLSRWKKRGDSNSLAKKLGTKEGDIRKHGLGKPGIHVARTVINPSVDEDIWTVRVAALIALKLTKPIKVTELNIKDLKARILRGAFQREGANSIVEVDPVTGNQRKRDLSHARPRELERVAKNLSVGWIVNRTLIDGDVIYMNRQPTLHKMGIMAFLIRIVNALTIAFELACTPLFNADFDGDEMNLGNPQNQAVEAEYKGLMLVSRQMMNPRTNTVAIAPVQDSLLGAYMLTCIDTYFSFADACQMMTCIHYHAKERIDEYMADTTRVRSPTEAMADCLLPHELSTPAVWVRANRSSDGKHAIWKRYYTGKQLFSGCMPRMEMCRIPNTAATTPVEHSGLDAHEDDSVIIRHGELLLGRLRSNVTGASPGGLVENVVMLYNNNAAARFVSDFQRICGNPPFPHNVSIGLDDLVIGNEDLQKGIQDYVASRLKRFKTLMTAYRKRCGETQTRAGLPPQEVLDEVEGIRSKLCGIALGSMDTTNAIRNVLMSGAKGKADHFVQMSWLLGLVSTQTLFYGSIFLANGQHRTSPFAAPNPTDAKAFAFVENAFTKGLDPLEFIFHTGAGREGLSDQAVRVSNTGHIYRSTVKAQSSAMGNELGNLVTADETILMSQYGGDGFDPEQIMEVPIDYLWVDLAEFCSTFLRLPSQEVENLQHRRHHSQGQARSPQANDTSEDVDMEADNDNQYAGMPPPPPRPKDTIFLANVQRHQAFPLVLLRHLMRMSLMARMVERAEVPQKALLPMNMAMILENVKANNFHDRWEMKAAQRSLPRLHEAASDQEITATVTALCLKVSKFYMRYMNHPKLRGVFGMVLQHCDDFRQVLMQDNEDLVKKTAQAFSFAILSPGIPPDQVQAALQAVKDAFEAGDQHPRRAEAAYRSFVAHCRFSDGLLLTRCVLALWLNSIVAHGITRYELYSTAVLVEDRILKARITPGHMSGSLSASCFGEPLTQMLLNTFHTAGTKKLNQSVGVTRVSEIVSAKNTAETCGVLVPTTSLEEAYSLANEVVGMPWNELAVGLEIVDLPTQYPRAYAEMSRGHSCVTPDFLAAYEEDPSATPSLAVSEKDPDDLFDPNEFYRDMASIFPEGIDPFMKSLVSHDMLTPTRLNTGCLPGKRSEVCAVWKPKKLLRFRVREGYSVFQAAREFQAVVSTSAVVSHSLRRREICVVLIPTRDDIEEKTIRTLHKKIMMGRLSCHGTSHVKAAHVTTMERVLPTSHLSNTQAIAPQDQAIVSFEGSNLKLILEKGSLLSRHLAYANNIVEVVKVLGIEAGKAVMKNEFYNAITADGTVIDPRHLELNAAVAMKTGRYRGMDRFHMNHMGGGIITAITFEEFMSKVSEAAMFGKSDNLRSITSCIIVGREGRIGTGYCDLIDPMTQRPVNEYALSLAVTPNLTNSLPSAYDETRNMKRILQEQARHRAYMQHTLSQQQQRKRTPNHAMRDHRILQQYKHSIDGRELGAVGRVNGQPMARGILEPKQPVKTLSSAVMLLREPKTFSFRDFEARILRRETTKEAASSSEAFSDTQAVIDYRDYTMEGDMGVSKVGLQGSAEHLPKRQRVEATPDVAAPSHSATTGGPAHRAPQDSNALSSASVSRMAWALRLGKVPAYQENLVAAIEPLVRTVMQSLPLSILNLEVRLGRMLVENYNPQREAFEIDGREYFVTTAVEDQLGNPFQSEGDMSRMTQVDLGTVPKRQQHMYKDNLETTERQEDIMYKVGVAPDAFRAIQAALESPNSPWTLQTTDLPQDDENTAPAQGASSAPSRASSSTTAAASNLEALLHRHWTLFIDVYYVLPNNTTVRTTVKHNGFNVPMASITGDIEARVAAEQGKQQPQSNVLTSIGKSHIMKSTMKQICIPVHLGPPGDLRVSVTSEVPLNAEDTPHSVRPEFVRFKLRRSYRMGPWALHLTQTFNGKNHLQVLQQIQKSPHSFLCDVKLELLDPMFLKSSGKSITQITKELVCLLPFMYAVRLPQHLPQYTTDTIHAGLSEQTYFSVSNQDIEDAPETLGPVDTIEL